MNLFRAVLRIRWINRLSFRTKLLLQSVLSVCLALLLAGAMMIWNDYQNARSSIVSQLTLQTDIVAENLGTALALDDRKTAEEILGSFRADPQVAFACAHHDGEVFATYARNGAARSIHSEPPSGGHIFSNRHLMLARPVTIHGERLGTVVVRYDLGPMYARVRNGVVIILGILIIAMLLAMLFSLGQLRALARPIYELRKTARHISSRADYDLRAVRYSSDELGDLTDAFNDMLEQIQSRDLALQQANDELESRVALRTAELTESEERNRVILETALDAIIIMDAQGSITGWNPQAESTFGWSAEEAVGRRVADLIVPERLREAHNEGLRRFLDHGEGDMLGRRREVQAQHRDGREFPAEIAINVLIANDQTLFSAFIRDITDRKRKEQELRDARDEAEAASRAKSDFLANMSHEIRTPMTAILGFGEMLLDPERTPSDRYEYIQTIQRNGHHLLQIINDVLDISKIEAGKFEVNIATCSPCQIVVDAISLMRVRAEEKGIDLLAEFPTPLPETIDTDPGRLRQILINLISNAIKFTEQGAVRLVTRLLDDPHKPMLQFECVDTGIGISDDLIEQLFKPFSQGDESMSRKHGGTGLGLTISRHFAEMLGGSLNVTSRPGEGSTFTLRIATGPLEGVPVLTSPSETFWQQEAKTRLSSAEVIERHRAKTSVCRGARILLVEDGPDNQRLITHCLRRAGFEIELAENGRIGLDAAVRAREAGEPFDVILMDMQMPVLDGYQAVSMLRDKGYEGTIIALTAHAMSGDREKCLRVGCDDYASKPIDRMQLIRLIETYVLHASREQQNDRCAEDKFAGRPDARAA